MISDKLENVYKLLTDHNFDAKENIPDKFKCGKCGRILIEACQTRCGCRFCRNCVDEMMNNVCQFCPGVTSDCKIELLSNFVVDYRVNKQISKLILKCPEEMCSHECELLEMSEHLRICGEKSVECPFYKLGCDMRKMTNEKLIEHFQLENYNHNKTLIDMIDNIKNEVQELREKELKNLEEINKLKANLQLKDEKLKSINAEMEMIKMDKLDMEKHLKTVGKMFDDDISKLKSEHEKEVQSIKKEKEVLDEQMQIGSRNAWYAIDEIESTNKEIKSENDEIRLKTMEVCKQTIDKSIMQMGSEQKLNDLERNSENKMDGIFEMMIGNVDELRNKFGLFGILSDYFYARSCPYKLRLDIYPSFGIFDDQLRIYFFILDDVMNRDLPIPFTADVTMKITNKNKREVSKTITKYCQIEKPKNNSSNGSDGFIYRYSELTESGILESNCFIVECCVALK